MTDDLFAILRLLYYFSHIRTMEMEGSVSPAPGGNRAQYRLIVKPALHPFSYRTCRETKRQSDSQPATQTDNQLARERE